MPTSLVQNWHRRLVLSRDHFLNYLKQHDKKTALLKFAYRVSQKRTCQDNISLRDSPLQTSRTAFLTLLAIYFFLKRCIEIPKNAILYVRVVSDEP